MRSASSLLAAPTEKHLVLIGGGHSHAIVLKRWGMKPLPGVRLTLITNVCHTPYSGMLPGYVAGLYRFEDCHIDLRPLAEFAGASMVVSSATGLDLDNNRVLLADRPPIAFDLLSIDIGSTPATLSIPGASEHAIPVKPIAQFLQQWDRIVAAVTEKPDRPMRIAIVGGGAGGVELALAVQARLQQVYQDLSQPTQLEMHLFQRGDRLIPERGRRLGDRLQQILIDRGIHLHLGETVTAVKAEVQEKTASGKIVLCESGLEVGCDVLLWVTQAAAASWLGESGLATDDRGFLWVNDRLQSCSHPQVFAAGDVATMVDHPRPKAGVFAVRQGKPLSDNLRHALLDQPLQPFVPQKEFLILVGTGDGSALASRGTLSLGPYPLFWKWKDWIDRRFMAKFSQLEPMETGEQTEQSSQANSVPLMHCAGCGSKVGSSVLERVLQRIQLDQTAQTNQLHTQQQREDILIGLEAADDAAVVAVPPGQVMVQTVDHFRALLDDPFVFGQICTNHCLSDLFAMAATPQSAMAIVTLPYGTEPQQTEMLYQLLSGATKALSEAGAVLIGGHTTEGNELAFGLSCNGLAYPDRLWRKSGMQPGQKLILTKAIGTGTLFAANMRLQAKGDWIESAIESMLQSNGAAATCLQEIGATACTDITGFGLVGH
ncbi:MAG TPA: selenide, water dikinase SelD, partial [Allocoleopsis sp.]